jgi:hypothetical protein
LFYLIFASARTNLALTIKNHPKPSIDFTMTPRFFAVAVLALQAATSPSLAFTPARILAGSQPTIMARQQMRLYGAVSTSDEIGAVSSMRAGEIKKELESYGISTVSFLEKSELVDALVGARAKGLKPKENTKATTSSTMEASAETSTSTTSIPTDDGRPREERLKEEMEKLRDMKASEMKKELEQRGVSTASFFEKSEFLKALAEARVDNVQATGGKKKKKRRDGDVNEEGYAEYSNVEVITDDAAGPRKKGGSPPSDSSAGGPFGGGSSPFGSGGMPGGMGMNLQDLMGAMGGGGGGMPGGMGGIGDMLKNMGGMGGMGGPGGAGSPFGGDMMGKAQQMMKNPKVMELMMKAQKNPKVMAAMQECMSNPAAFAKYRNDPEVSELIKELEKYA